MLAAECTFLSRFPAQLCARSSDALSWRNFPPLHRDVHLRDTSPVAAFSFRGGYRIDEGRWVPPAAFTGLRETLRAHEHCDGHAVLWATFYTGIGHAVATYTTIDWRLPPDRCRYHEMADWPA